jgi:hypothetical protein
MFQPTIINMNYNSFLPALLLFACSCAGTRSTRDAHLLSTQWQTGHDSGTIQLIPSSGNDALTRDKNSTVVHVKFVVKQYGEVSCPINANTVAGEEALRADLSGKKSLRITYRANQSFIIQLRQTGVHGGVHNHVDMPASRNDTTISIPFLQFGGGLKPLDLADVAKFNFAFLSNNERDGFAELVIRGLELEHTDNRK